MIYSVFHEAQVFWGALNIAKIFNVRNGREVKMETSIECTKKTSLEE